MALNFRAYINNCCEKWVKFQRRSVSTLCIYYTPIDSVTVSRDNNIGVTKRHDEFNVQII